MKYLSYSLRRVALLLLFWAAVVHFTVVLPPFEGSDEDKHFGYVTHLRQTGSLPDPRESLNLPAKQASGQSPLYYLMVWLWSGLGSDYVWDGTITLNPYVNPVRPVLYEPDNANVFMYGPDQITSINSLQLTHALMWQRWLSPFMGMLAVALAYAAARLLLSRKWALFAMLLFAFNPVLVFMFAYVTNDASGILAGTAITCCLVMMLRRHTTPRMLLITGVITGLGVLTKASILVFAPIVIMAGVFALWGRGIRGSAIFKGVMLLSLPIVLIGMPWYVWNAVQYGDPFGMQPHLRTFWALGTPRSISEALLVTLRDGAYQIRSMWYGIASGVVISSHTVLLAPLLILVQAGIGIVRGWRTLYRWYRLILITLAMIVAGIFAAYVMWLTRFDSVTGRLLLPGYLALVLLLTLGLAYGWRSSRGLRLVAGTVVVFGAVIISGNITLPRFYTMFTMPPENVPPLSGEMAQFGDVQLLGYQLEPEHLLPGMTPRATLCWRSLREDVRLVVPYAFAFHITGQDNTVYFGRDSYPGLGLYTNWQPGRAFCDHFSLDMREAVVSGRGYQVAIGLFDPNTQERVPEKDGKTFIGWIGAPGLVLTETDTPEYNFEGVYLLDYSMSDNGDLLTVQADWGTGNWQPRPLTVFIHVLDEDNQPVTQLDVPLGGDEYPSALWGNNEHTHRGIYQLSLPDELSPGDYSVLFGLYDAERRLSVLNAEGVAQVDGIVRLGILRL
ncbi:MAG: glycosyltransferase family 39 protein [Anaerolineae bacterium]|nr:glycosyltransferase family 39 protein [Anaerolineae bacterium]